MHSNATAPQTNSKAILQRPYCEISHPAKIFSQTALRRVGKYREYVITRRRRYSGIRKSFPEYGGCAVECDPLRYCGAEEMFKMWQRAGYLKAVEREYFRADFSKFSDPGPCPPPSPGILLDRKGPPCTSCAKSQRRRPTLRPYRSAPTVRSATQQKYSVRLHSGTQVNIVDER